MLLMVLVFVMVVGLALAALLPYTQVGISEASTARDVRSTQNAVDGAMQGAIAQVRADLEQGNERSGRCDTYNAAGYPLPVGAATVGVTVTCQNALRGVGGGGADVPPYAIVTTQGDLNDSGGNALSVDGGVYVTGAINTTGSSMSKVVVVGDAYSAAHTCGNVTATGLTCPTGAIPLPQVNFPSALGDDATTAAATIAGLAKDPPGTCTSDQSIVTFTPGYYSEPPTPGASCSSNNSSTWWFSPCTPYPSCASTATSPGIYYFDFPDDSYGPSYADVSLLDLDSIKLDLIGGSLVGGLDASATEAAVQAIAPGKRCDQSSAGVQVILGGATRVATGIHSAIELCASQTSPTSLQKIALYGLSSSFGLPTSPSGARPTTSNGPAGVPAVDVATTTTGDSAFRDLGDTAPNPDGARVTNDGLNVAVASFTSATPKFGATLTSFPPITDGSLVTEAYLDVTHLETSSALKPQLLITYSSGQTDKCVLNSTNTPLPVPLTQPALTTTRVDLMNDCQSNYLKNAPHRWSELNPQGSPTKKLVVTYEVPKASAVVGSKAIVDGVQLQTTVVKPALEAERCPSPAGASCVVEGYSNSHSTATANTYFIGTIFTPSASINVVVHNSPNTIFQRGVVVSALTIVANASSTQTDPPFQLPHSAVRNRTVLFTATTDGRVRLRALVHFIDCLPAPACEATPNATGNLVWPGKLAQIKEWTTLQ